MHLATEQRCSVSKSIWLEVAGEWKLLSLAQSLRKVKANSLFKQLKSTFSWAKWQTWGSCQKVLWIQEACTDPSGDWAALANPWLKICWKLEKYQRKYLVPFLLIPKHQPGKGSVATNSLNSSLFAVVIGMVLRLQWKGCQAAETSFSTCFFHLKAECENLEFWGQC